MGAGGCGAWLPEILKIQLALSQPGGPIMPTTLLRDHNPPRIFRHSYGPAGYNEHKRPKITLAKCSSSLGFLPSLKNTSQPQTKKIEKGRQIEARVCLFF